MINLLRYDRDYSGMIQVAGYSVAFAVSGEAHDYVEETSMRMRLVAKKLLTYPFYLTFESYDEMEGDILAKTDLPIHYAPSGRTVLTQRGRKLFQAEVPTFTVEIANEQALNDVFEHWFYLAFDNHLWVVYQHPTLTYKQGFAFMTLTPQETILVTEHDAYGFTFMTNEPHYESEANVQKVIEGALSDY